MVDRITSDHDADRDESSRPRDSGPLTVVCEPSNRGARGPSRPGPARTRRVQVVDDATVRDDEAAALKPRKSVVIGLPLRLPAVHEAAKDPLSRAAARYMDDEATPTLPPCGDHPDDKGTMIEALLQSQRGDTVAPPGRVWPDRLPTFICLREASARVGGESGGPPPSSQQGPDAEGVEEEGSDRGGLSLRAAPRAPAPRNDPQAFLRTGSS